MEVDKRGLKGGFLQLFDWTGKSRKKLFSNISELPGSKQGKENVENVTSARLHLIEVDENGASSSNKGISNYNCASSVTSDDGYGTKAPGVVARLMGLDSLPTSNVCEPCATPFVDSYSLRDACYHRSNTSFQSEQHMNYTNMCNRLEEFSRNSVKSMPQKKQSRPIERFQTEILPPKSAKSIPITHHKLLSPIKGPGFIPTKNAAYIMEAAAKIIEPGPQTTTKGKIPSFGCFFSSLKNSGFERESGNCTESIQASKTHRS
ncbi:hypothetical protein L1049_019460 [Liquidambar formosana]|uniref:DUF3741 domain-containing protein n=1 Tax=Liquidambar formosana TaxID=63359 RepID=A0AAP0SBE5_LIQFO